MGSTPYKQQSRCWNLGGPTQHFTTVLHCVPHKLCSETNKTPSSMRYFFFGSVWQCQQRYFLSDLDSKWFEKWNRGVWKWSSCLIFITEWLWGIGGLGFRTAKETCLLVLNFSMDGPHLRPPSSASSQWGSPQRRDDWVGLLVTRSWEGGSYEPIHQLILSTLASQIHHSLPWAERSQDIASKGGKIPTWWRCIPPYCRVCGSYLLLNFYTVVHLHRCLWNLWISYTAWGGGCRS